MFRISNCFDGNVLRVWFTWLPKLDGRDARAGWPGGAGELDVRTGNASFGCDSGGSVSYGKALGLSRYSFSDLVIFVCLVDF